MAKQKLYCCDNDNKQLYRDNYTNQCVNGMPVSVGRRYQRGHGIGQTLGGLFKRFVVPLVAPYAKNIGKKILRNVAKTGMELLGMSCPAEKSEYPRTWSHGYKKNCQRHCKSDATTAKEGKTDEKKSRRRKATSLLSNKNGVY